MEDREESAEKNEASLCDVWSGGCVGTCIVGRDLLFGCVWWESGGGGGRREWGAGWGWGGLGEIEVREMIEVMG